MNPEKTAEMILAAGQQQHDPVFVGLAWLLGILFMIVALAKPFMGMVRQYRRDNADNARDKADEAVYARLKEQIEQNSTDIRNLIDERNKWHEEAIELRARVTQLESCEQLVKRMKEKLDEKDSQLRDREDENRRLMYEIIQLKDRLHQLELRLAEDERKFCATCELKHAAGA